jgi:8-oxo-dGTP pyrophosphatase MutT (NUDIX family)
MASLLSLDTVKKALSLPLPGREAQLRMSTRPRPGDSPPFDEKKFRDGAVLLLIYPVRDSLYLPLTKRTVSVASHKGHISLPGGAREGDEMLVETALRETKEEIGVSVAREDVIGTLSSIHVPVSGYRVKPFVAQARTRPSFLPDPSEVEEMIELPLDLILSRKTVETEWQTHGGTRMLVPHYRCGIHKIWGATAMILSELAEALAKAVESR